MTVRYLDLGQGNSILVQAGGKNMLIDAGPAIAGPSVVSSLKAAGVSYLDVIVALHHTKIIRGEGRCFQHLPL